MSRAKPVDDVSAAAQEVLGYLNFSSGTSDPRFLANVNCVFARAAADAPKGVPAWRALENTLRAVLRAVEGRSDAFRRVEQAEAVLSLTFDAVLPAYRAFHRDLLFHQTDEALFQPFFLGRVFEAVLRQGGPWNETDRIVRNAIANLNDYIGYRPVAVLHTEQKIQPYEHEWVRPIPLWIRGAGTAAGPYAELVEAALAILDATDPALLREAMFSMEQLDELAFDPRAYDFDHPVNKRPNYLFGEWDMHALDNAGRCRRFVLRQAALDAMLERLRGPKIPSRREAVWEEAAVLAGTMLMGSGVSGNRPDAHDSTTTLATLVQKIAAYRDAFYEALLTKVSGPRAKRLQAEAKRLRQPFGGARQHLNHFLAQRRARQLEHSHLSEVFAAIGHDKGAVREAAVVPTPSIRMKSEIACRMTAAHRAVDCGRLAEAAEQLPPIEDVLHRAIQCGALIDPWNILGFSGQFSLFPAVENSIQDYRADELLDLVSDIFALYARIHQATAAVGDDALGHSLLGRLEDFAHWWDQFATVEVDAFEPVSGRDALESTRRVAEALRAWHKGGAAAGDLAFWRRHVEEFRSPKAFALVVETLLDRADPVAAMALLMQWLSQAEEIPLVEEDYSFNDLAVLWMEDLWRGGPGGEAQPKAGVPREQRWPLAKKFIDYLEANAEELWHVPRFELDDGDGENSSDENDADWDALGGEEDDLYGAAYENVTYRDSTDDGVESEVSEGGESELELELVGESERIVYRLNFLTTVAQLWKYCAAATLGDRATDRDEALSGWLAQAAGNYRRLLALLAAVHRHRIPPPSGSHESLVEYDRLRSIKESLLEEIIEACVETADAARMLRVSMHHPPAADASGDWEPLAERVLAAALRGDAPGVRRNWPAMLRAIEKQPLLYVALGRGGPPRRIVASRGLQYVLRRLLICLPRLGLLTETCRLLETAQGMEARHPVGAGGVTEFDHVYEIGCRAIFHALVVSSESWKSAKEPSANHSADRQLIEGIETAVEALLFCWLRHSAGVRLSVLESVVDPDRWRILCRFIKRYGGDLFTQHFMNLGNLRGILHRGAANYLQTLLDEPDAGEPCRLVSELHGAISLNEAAYWLDLILEAVVENYGEYIDYNSITTQSDRGDMLYTLLDFLRLQANYHRVAWNLRPVLLAHQVLERCGRSRAADIWRDAVVERTEEIADDFQRRFEQLCKTHGMRLPSVAERLRERFIRPLEINRLCAFVAPAVEEIRNGPPKAATRRLEREIARFMREPPGAGFQLPSWLEALEGEVDRVRRPNDPHEEDDWMDSPFHLPQVRLTRADAEKQLRQMLLDPTDKRKKP